MRRRSFHRQLHGVTYRIPLLFLLRQHSKIYLAAAPRPTNSSAWNHILKFLRLALDERNSHTAVASPHSREYTKEPIISALPNSRPMKKVELDQNYGMYFVQEKMRGRRGSSCRFDCLDYIFSVAAHLWDMTNNKYQVLADTCPLQHR